MLEIIGFDREGAITAQEAGADRIELCTAPHMGGTTPDKEFISWAIKHLQVPIAVMIRCRGGNFVYSEAEMSQMVEELSYCKKVGVRHIVFGALDASGFVDMEKCKLIRCLAPEMTLTFHRAFDEGKDPIANIEAIIDLGYNKLLTSGMKPTAPEGKILIRNLVTMYGKRISIMPGSGVTSSNLRELKTFIKAKEWHSSAKLVNNNNTYLGVSANEVVAMKNIL